jgi:hypothetical protein
MTEGKTVEVAALSWILELPRDLGLEEGLRASLMNSEAKLAGWEGHHQNLPDWFEGSLDAVPIKRLRFRRAYVDIGTWQNYSAIPFQPWRTRLSKDPLPISEHVERPHP